MNAIFKRTLRDRRLSLLAFCLGGLGLVILYSSIFPSIQQQSQAFQQAFKSLPEGLSKAFGIDASIYTSLTGYLGVELFSITWPIIAMFLVISTAGSALAGEVERRTMGLLLSSPVSRTVIYWSKYLAGMVGFLLFVLFSLGSIFPIALVMGINAPLHVFTPVIGLASLFGLAVYSIAMMLSSLFNERGKVYAATAGIVALMYVANIVASLQDKVSWLKYASFFYYFNYAEVLRGTHINARSLAVFLGTIIIASLAGWGIFIQKNLSI